MRKPGLHIFVFSVAVMMCCGIASRYGSVFDLGSFMSHLHTFGFAVVLVPIPYVLVSLSDTYGWLMSFGDRAGRIPLRALLPIRIATETLQVSLPGGAMYAELARPYLLRRLLQVEFTESIPANVITKVNIFVAQAMFVACGFSVVVMGSAGDLLSTSVISRYHLHAAGALTMVLPFLLAYLLYTKNLVLWAIRLLERIDSRIARRVLHNVRKPLTEMNAAISDFFRKRKAGLLLTVMFFLLSWVLMAVESLIILAVIGVDAGLLQAIAIESLMSLIRMIFFFIPGAVGPQDVSLVFLFTLAGIPDPLTNSLLYVFLKRSKEALWIAVGYVLLASLGVRPRQLLHGHRLSAAETP